jgi:hypothetical protein
VRKNSLLVGNRKDGLSRLTTDDDFFDRTISTDQGKPAAAVPVTNSCVLRGAAAPGDGTASPTPISNIWPEIWPALSNHELWLTDPDGTCARRNDVPGIPITEKLPRLFESLAEAVVGLCGAIALYLLASSTNTAPGLVLEHVRLMAWRVSRWV